MDGERALDRLNDLRAARPAPTTIPGCRSYVCTWSTTAASISAADTRRTRLASPAASPFAAQPDIGQQTVVPPRQVAAVRSMAREALGGRLGRQAWHRGTFGMRAVFTTYSNDL